MNETTDGELNFLLKDIPDFNGCHNKDIKQIKNGYTIINLNGSSHWTAIARNGNEFFIWIVMPLSRPNTYQI